MITNQRIKILCLLSLVSVLAYGQQYLYIKKKGELPAERLARFDRIKIRTTDSDDWIKGNLDRIAIKSITVNDRVYPLKSIAGVRTYNHLVRLGGTAIWGAGALFTAIALFNRLVNGDRPVLYPGQIAFGAGVVAAGGLISWLGRNTYLTSEGYYLEVIDLEKNYEP